MFDDVIILYIFQINTGFQDFPSLIRHIKNALAIDFHADLAILYFRSVKSFAASIA